MTMASGDSTGSTSLRNHFVVLILQGCNGQPGTAGPSDDSLELSQFAGIVQTCRNLFAREVGKFRDDLLGGFFGRQVPKHNSDRNARSLEPRLAAQDSRITYDVFFSNRPPCVAIVARFQAQRRVPIVNSRGAPPLAGFAKGGVLRIPQPLRYSRRR